MDQRVNPLPIDFAWGAVPQRGLNPNPHEFVDDKWAPVANILTLEREQPEPVTMSTHQHGGIEDSAKRITCVHRIRRTHARRRPSATRRAASSSENSSRSKEMPA